jgi:hypothetical protein
MKLYLGKLDSQSMGSATTYARRYSYMSVLGLVADEDDDANKATVRHDGGGESQSRGQSVEGKQDDDPRLVAILKAEGHGNDFVDQLCGKYRQYGSLSEKQLDSGLNAAGKALGNETRTSAPRTGAIANEPQDYPFAEPEERF